MKPKACSGAHGQYQWIELSEMPIMELFENVPSLAVGKYLVNTSYDSGFLTLSVPQFAAGWHHHVLPKKAEENLCDFPERITFTAAISNVAEIPFDFHDEWYVFNFPVSPNLFDDCEIFVNWCDFSLQDKRVQGFSGQVLDATRKIGARNLLVRKRKFNLRYRKYGNICRNFALGKLTINAR